MRTCPLGHENPDDATTCTVCLRRLPTEAVTLDLLPAAGPTLVAEAGSSTVLALGLRQRGGEAMHCALSATGAITDWVAPAVATSAPGRTITARLTLTVPAGESAGDREITVVARPVDQEGPAARIVVPVRVSVARHDPVITPPRPQPPPPVRTVLRRSVPDAPALPVRRRTPPTDPPVRPRRSPPPPTDLPRPLRSRHLRRRGRQPVALVVMIGIVLVAAVGLWQVLDRDLTPRGALELSEADALDELVRIRDRDRDEVGDLLRAEGAVALQLSSKCRGFEEVDLTGPDGLGHPDGAPEQLPGGVGSSGILAFHLGISRSRGTTLLAIEDDLGAPRPCEDGSPRWITLHLPASGSFGSVDEALCGCADRDLPFGECGARGADGTVVFWLPRTVPEACRDQVAGTTGAPPSD